MKYLTIPALIVLLTACSSNDISLPPIDRGPTLPGAIVYQCSGGDEVNERIEALYADDIGTVTVLFAGEQFQLAKVPTGSGERYSDGSVTWWTEGTQALWQMDQDLLLRDCQQK